MIRLQVRQGEQVGRTVESDAPLIGIGRNPENVLQLPDYHLSGEHGQIFREDEHWVYRDLRSTNGSRVQRGDTVVDLDTTARREFALRDGDVLLLGDATAPVAVTCRVQEDEAADEARTLAVRSRADLPNVAG